MKLKLSKDLDLPHEAVTQTFAILAKRGVGKTYTASVMVEEMLKAQLQVVVVDPIGVWWGLRSSADGKTEGLPIIIAGGEHADVPIESTSGEVLAGMIVEQHLSMVIDISLFRKHEQHKFMTAFAETLYRKNRQALHLVLDEADEFAPQRALGGDEPRMLGAIEDLVRRGRARGIGVTMITQRPAVLNKNVLTQIEVLVALRLTSPQDRAAIAEWVKYHADAGEAQEMLQSLGSLPVGTAWFWSPGWLNLFKKVAIRQRETLDSSSTPKVGQQIITPKKMAKVDLEKIREQLSSTIEKVKSDDPKELRRQIGELKHQLFEQKPQVEVRSIELLPHELKKKLQLLTNKADRAYDLVMEVAADAIQLRDWVGQFAEASDDVSEFQHGKFGESLTTENAAKGARQFAEAVTPDQFKKSDPVKVVRDYQNRVEADNAKLIGEQFMALGNREVFTDLRKGELRMLAVIGRSWPQRLTKAQMAFMAKMKITGGTFGAYYGRLKREGYLTEMADSTLEPSDKALAAVGVERTQAPKTAAEQIAMWREVLPAGAEKMLDVIIGNDSGVNRDQLAELAGFTASGGTFGAYLGMLRRNGIIETEGDIVRLAKGLS